MGTTPAAVSVRLRLQRGAPASRGALSARWRKRHSAHARTRIGAISSTAHGSSATNVNATPICNASDASAPRPRPPGHHVTHIHTHKHRHTNTNTHIRTHSHRLCPTHVLLTQCSRPDAGTSHHIAPHTPCSRSEAGMRRTKRAGAGYTSSQSGSREPSEPTCVREYDRRGPPTSENNVRIGTTVGAV